MNIKNPLDIVASRSCYVGCLVSEVHFVFRENSIDFAKITEIDRGRVLMRRSSLPQSDCKGFITFTVPGRHDHITLNIEDIERMKQDLYDQRTDEEIATEIREANESRNGGCLSLFTTLALFSLLAFSLFST